MNENQGSPSIMHVFGRLLMLPMTAFVHGIEMLIKTMQGVQQVSKQGMEVMVGSQAQLNGLPETRAAPAAPVEQPPPVSRNDIAAPDSSTTEIIIKE